MRSFGFGTCFTIFTSRSAFHPVASPVVAAALAALLTACSSDTTAAHGPVGTSGPTDAITPTISLHGSAVGFPAGDPLSDFAVCLSDANPAVCTTTDTAGEFGLPVPANQNIAVTFVRDGYTPILAAIRTGSKDLDLRPLAYSGPLTDVSAVAASLGVQWDQTKGLVDVDAAPVHDGVVTFTPKSGEGPFSTFGLMIFANIDPGEVEFSATSAAGSCSFSDLLWRGSNPGTVKLPIAAGFLTRLISVDCPPGDAGSDAAAAAK